jgi:3-hydroxyacyl-CoA dehydrogenase/enoyl-CoA hydratase/3-hydroxybutyryl-CoA epimerase
VPTRQLHDAARATVMKPPTPSRASGWKAWTNNMLVRPLLAQYLRKQVAKRARREHYPAPYAIIDLWEKHADSPKRMLAEEAASIAKLVMGETSRNLVRVFFLQEQVKSLGKGTELSPAHVHVIGGGVMGGDIAAWCALRGLKVTIQDRKEENLARVLKRAHGLYKKRLKQPRVIKAAMDNLIPDMEGIGLSHADVIIEAIFEDIDAKHALFREIEPRVRPDALITTNTSSIPLEVLAKALQQPERLVGLHFFNPVARMQLVEIVSGEQTDSEVAQLATAFTRRIDRLPVPVKSKPGFLVNRVLMPYLMEAVILESEGVPTSVIDDAALKFGMPMGPIHLADTVGLDICLHVAENLAGQVAGEVPMRLRNLVSAGNLGVKTGKGFYTYSKGKPDKPKVDPGYVPPDDLEERLMFRMLNECVACLREGVVETPDLLDAGVIFGTGFAPFRGGPMNYIHHRGAAAMHSRIMQLSSRYGNRFEEDAGWSSL